MLDLNDLRRHRALYEGIADSLRERIYLHDLAPGTPIDELALARTYGVSRTPIREALKVLAHEGLLEMKVRCGCCVASRTRDDLVEILEVMGLLLVHGLRQLALRGSDRDLAGLLSPGSGTPSQGAAPRFWLAIANTFDKVPGQAIVHELSQQLGLCLGRGVLHLDIEPDLPQRSELLQALITRNIRALEHWASRYWQHLSETALRVFDGAHRHCQVA